MSYQETKQSYFKILMLRTHIIIVKEMLQKRTLCYVDNSNSCSTTGRQGRPEPTH